MSVRLLLLFLLVVFHNVFAADSKSAPPARYQPNKAEAVKKLLLANGPPARAIALPTPTAQERAKLGSAASAGSNRADGDKNRPLQIGYSRVPAAADQTLLLTALSWQAVDGGKAAQVTLTSPTAAAIRLALAWKAAPDKPGLVEFRFTGAKGSQVFGPISGAKLSAAALFWSPVLEGDTATLEIFVPSGVEIKNSVLAIPQISHLQVAGAALVSFAKTVQDIGRATACEIDIACVSNPSPALLDEAKSVAQLVFTDVTSGTTFVCSGNLLNTTDSSFIPYLYTADHCINTQDLANTVNTYWFFAAAQCGSKATPNFVIIGGGAVLLYHDMGSDASFLRLNSQPPAGVQFGGWNANPVSASTPASVLHYPAGDLEKFSQGTILGFGTFNNQGSFITVRYTDGSTEAGSSGAGLLTFNPGGFYELRGGLFGGDAACNNPTGTDSYSRLDLVYPFIAQFLSPAPSGIGTFAFENPQSGSFQSGIGFFSGWSCSGPTIAIAVDGMTPISVPYGSARADTARVCGAANINTGFGLLVNFNTFGAGTHTAQLFVNGVAQGAPVSFTVTVPAGEFLTGVSKQIVVSDFPFSGKTTTLLWQESQQNFAIQSVGP